ncbi:AAA ATPase-like protein [Streptomyces sp. TLI_235]|nr:AAA ATPase-like protein [Streptomyces sp. TLI_235]
MGNPVRLVGRVEKMASLTRLVESVVVGHGGAGVIRGDAGTGKTALLDSLEAQCRRAGLRVLRGAGAKLERQVPFAAVQSCLQLHPMSPRGDLQQISRLLQGVGGAAGRDWHLAVADAMADLLGRWFAERPGAVLLDDVQWADAWSTALVGRLLGLLKDQPVLLVAAGRPAPELSVLLREFEARGARLWELGPLAEPEVAALVQQLVGGCPNTILLERIAPAAGNPLFVTELVAAYQRLGAVRVRDGVAGVAPGSGDMGGALPSDSLREIFADRFGCLSSRMQDVLEVAALLGAGASVEDVSTVSGIPPDEVRETVRLAAESGVLVGSGSNLFVFRHPLIRQALADRMPAATRSALLAYAKRVLSEADPPVGRPVQRPPRDNRPSSTGAFGRPTCS